MTSFSLIARFQRLIIYLLGGTTNFGGSFEPNVTHENDRNVLTFLEYDKRLSAELFNSSLSGHITSITLSLELRAVQILTKTDKRRE